MIGFAFWVVAAVFMHFVGPYVFDGRLLHIGFWIANFVFPAAALPLIARATRRSRHDMLVPTTFMALPILALDSLAITFDTLGRSHIYADTPELAGLTGGFLLMALGSFFFWALIWHRP